MTGIKIAIKYQNGFWGPAGIALDNHLRYASLLNDATGNRHGNSRCAGKLAGEMLKRSARCMRKMRIDQLIQTRVELCVAICACKHNVNVVRTISMCMK